MVTAIFSLFLYISLNESGRTKKAGSEQSDVYLPLLSANKNIN